MGGFWAKNSLNVGGFLAKVAHRTGLISNSVVFLAIFTFKIVQMYQNSAVFLIIDHNCLMNFIGNYHKHGYSKKNSHISGWVPDFLAEHTRHFTYRVQFTFICISRTRK